MYNKEKFKMEEKLTRLYNTLALIETKGESTKLMAKCLDYVLALKQEAAAMACAPVKEGDESGGN